MVGRSGRCGDSREQGFVGGHGFEDVGVVMYYSACQGGEVRAEVEGVCQELRSVGVWTMVDDVSIECASAVVHECPGGGWSVGVCVLRYSEVVEILRGGLEATCYLVFV